MRGLGGLRGPRQTFVSFVENSVESVEIYYILQKNYKL